jgi:hypothetical protein
MYGILFHTNNSSSHVSINEVNHPSAIDANKNHIKVSRAMPGGSGRGGSFILIRERCLAGLERFVRDELSGKPKITADVDIVILSLGIGESL